MSERSEMKCNDCGKDLSDLSDIVIKRTPCPDCGSTSRHFFMSCGVTHEITLSVGIKVRDSSGFAKQESNSKQSHSEKTGLPVIITKEIDRTNPEFSSFHHKVEEIDEHGILSKTIHEHTDINPAKHRYKRKLKPYPFSNDHLYFLSQQN